MFFVLFHFVSLTETPKVFISELPSGKSDRKGEGSRITGLFLLEPEERSLSHAAIQRVKSELLQAFFPLCVFIRIE